MIILAATCLSESLRSDSNILLVFIHKVNNRRIVKKGTAPFLSTRPRDTTHVVGDRTHDAAPGAAVSVQVDAAA